jgi:hypothetical protein
MPPLLRALTSIFCIGFAAPLALGSEGSTPTGAPTLLIRAVEQYLENQGHWAYTESQNIVGLNGKSRGLTVLRVDPSENYAQQIKPLTIDGEPPTWAQLRHYRSKSEWLAKRRDRENQKEAGESNEAALENRVRLELGEQIAVPELESAAVVAEDERSVTYSVPFLTEEGKRSPLLDRFQVTVRINKLRGDLEHFAVRQQQPVRVMALAKVSEFEEDADFTSDDPRYPSVMTHDIMRATVSVLFFKRVVTANLDRTDLRHVANYDERFGVKLGPMRTLKF